MSVADAISLIIAGLSLLLSLFLLGQDIYRRRLAPMFIAPIVTRPGPEALLPIVYAEFTLVNRSDVPLVVTSVFIDFGRGYIANSQKAFTQTSTRNPEKSSFPLADMLPQSVDAHAAAVISVAFVHQQTFEHIFHPRVHLHPERHTPQQMGLDISGLDSQSPPRYNLQMIAETSQGTYSAAPTADCVDFDAWVARRRARQLFDASKN